MVIKTLLQASISYLNSVKTVKKQPKISSTPISNETWYLL